MVVDLPAPLGPRKPKNCPACTRKSTESTAVNAPNLRVNCSVAMAISLIREPLLTHPGRFDISSYYAGQDGKFQAVCMQESSMHLRRYRRTSRLSRSLRKNREHGRKFDAKHRSSRLTVVAEYLSAMFLHDSVTNAQPQSCAFAHGFSGVERIEDAVGFLDPGTRIGKKHHDVAAIPQAFGL